jgi:hypothetical protein
MYALRLVYQRHRKLAPWAGAMVALFLVTLITTMPVPRAGAAPAKLSIPTSPVPVQPIPAGNLAVLLGHQGLETAGEATLAFEPSKAAF